MSGLEIIVYPATRCGGGVDIFDNLDELNVILLVAA